MTITGSSPTMLGDVFRNVLVDLSFRELSPLRNVSDTSGICSSYESWYAIKRGILDRTGQNSYPISIFDIQDHVYAELNVVDTKAQSLLAFNAIMAAGILFFIGEMGLRNFSISMFFPLILFILSSVFCLLSITVFWMPVLSVEDEADFIDDLNSCLCNLPDSIQSDPRMEALNGPDWARAAVSQRILRLYRARNGRTVRYRIGWWLSLLAILLSVLFGAFVFVSWLGGSPTDIALIALGVVVFLSFLRALW